MAEQSEEAKAQLDAMLNGGVPFFDEDQEAPTSNDGIVNESSTDEESNFEENTDYFPPNAGEEDGEFLSEEEEPEFQNDDLIIGGGSNIEEPEAPTKHSAEYLQGQLDALKANGVNPQEPQQAQFTAQETQFLNAGKELHNLQQTNAPLYNKMLAMVQAEMNGTPQQAATPIDNSLKELEDLLASTEYNGLDSAPIKKLIAAQKASSASTQLELNRYKQNSQALNNRLLALESDKSTAAKDTEAARVSTQVAEYNKVSDELDIQIRADSKTMTKLMGLVRAGIPVREAFLDVTGKTEKDIKSVKAKPKTRGVSATRRSAPKKKTGTLSDKRLQLHDSLFGSVKSAKSLFK